MDIEDFTLELERIARNACRSASPNKAKFRLAYLCGGVTEMAEFNGSPAAARIATALELVLKGTENEPGGSWYRKGGIAK